MRQQTQMHRHQAWNTKHTTDSKLHQATNNVQNENRVYKVLHVLKKYQNKFLMQDDKPNHKGNF